MRLSKIYTKTGDKGETRLADGSSIAKTHPRLEAYGTVDELNAAVGWLKDTLTAYPELNHIDAQLAQIQNELFDIGGEFASPQSMVESRKSALINDRDVERLEQEMDRYNDELEPLANFVLPGGHPGNSAAHICRTICRRAERFAIQLKASEAIRDEPIRYLNRLSDWFFILSRHISHTLGVPELIWNQKKP
ncbi:cob(I)yrinic acid a,c-diamide adenosyltransferase [Pseudobacteriovorax antillogorgiicola]|uniref:Corrinoid adenosyltransferase n=1 Tax=Pseudobacteriovorax antillogorgiicola TaxID=1513793 RepID=A0A1Y6B386_9BACT|nr:cob(I)yrinic acid a,c-diamide adenosyltransferase [Pseudobacteriovorax antillogorgiicola]TCS59344.1 ATP:cob(I)alamin adenosyltransferase [Pseudobacteriovorax antillogorgiicola]SME89126.1 ATP:cob(I)alamin adenosyltransferase [Pseudobacteriovorax antillogorgiicola]